MSGGWRRAPIGLLAASFLFGTVAPAVADYRDGLRFFQQGDLERAAEEFRVEVETAPNYAYGWYMLGLISMKQKQFAEAEQHLRKAIELSPNKFAFYLGLAKLYASQGEYGKAAELLLERQGLAESEKDRQSLHTSLGFYFGKLGNDQEAVRYLEMAKSNPPDRNVLSRLGQGYFRLGDYDRAIANLKAAVELDSENDSLLFLLGTAYLNKAQKEKDEGTKVKLYDEAVLYARNLVLLKEDNHKYHNLLARALFGARRFGDALDGFRKVLDLKPDYCYAYTNIGKVYLSQNQYDRAEESLKNGIQCDGGNHATYEILGSVLEKQNRLEESLKAYRDAHGKKPTDVSRKGIARLEAKIKNRDIEQEQARLEAEAEKEYRKQLEEFQKYEKARKELYGETEEGKEGKKEDQEEDEPEE